MVAERPEAAAVAVVAVVAETEEAARAAAVAVAEGTAMAVASAAAQVAGERAARAEGHAALVVMATEVVRAVALSVWVVVAKVSNQPDPSRMPARRHEYPMRSHHHRRLEIPRARVQAAAAPQCNSRRSDTAAARGNVSCWWVTAPSHPKIRRPPLAREQIGCCVRVRLAWRSRRARCDAFVPAPWQ